MSFDERYRPYRPVKFVPDKAAALLAQVEKEMNDDE